MHLAFKFSDFGNFENPESQSVNLLTLLTLLTLLAGCSSTCLPYFTESARSSS